VALNFYNSKELIDPDKLRLKILIHGLHGTGKTSFMGSAKTEGVLKVGVCETGHGRGIMSIASLGFPACNLNSYNDFEEFCTGAGLQDANTIGLDSLSDASKTFIKDKALSIPRAKGESAKRVLGVPELDDYGSMAEITRKNIRKLLNLDKHIIVTAGLRIDKPDPENGQGEMLQGPDLPGQMFLGSTAMFDLVLALRTRSVLRDPKDAKSRYIERYYLTDTVGGVLAKNRLTVGEKAISFLPTEVIVDKQTGHGMFPWLLNEAKTAYAQFLAENPIQK
jgi:AAA domain